MSARAAALLATLVLAAACAPATPTPEPPTPEPAAILPASVELDPRWTAPVAWKPVAPGVQPVELGERTNARPGVLLFSDDLPLDVSFRVRAWELAPSDWCAVTKERDQIVLPWLMACVAELRLVVPDLVDCPGAAMRPTADALAAALVAHPTLGAIDLGPVDGSPILPPGLFAMPATGRIVVIPGTERRFDGATANPDRCQLPLASGAIELRGDSDAFLVLLDVGDRLAVVHLATGGIDRVTGTAARERGFASNEDGGDAALYRGILGGIGGISFQPGSSFP